MKRRKGFTLAELLVVVAIIAVLVAISIPIFTSQLHKAKVSTDLANLRNYYAELQTDYIDSDKARDDLLKKYGLSMESRNNTKFTDLNGNEVKLQDGYFALNFDKNKGYQISYYCNQSDKHYNNSNYPDCIKTIG